MNFERVARKAIDYYFGFAVAVSVITVLWLVIYGV